MRYYIIHNILALLGNYYTTILTILASIMEFINTEMFYY